LKFNNAIKSKGSRSIENITQLLRWCGLFEENELTYLTRQVISIADSDAIAFENSFAKVELKNRFGKITIRPIIFSIESTHLEGENQKFINGIDIIEFIWKCLCPDEKRTNCSTRYNFNNWGF
jgi:hypothetical protein